MFTKYIKHLIVILFLVFTTFAFAFDYSKVPEIVKTNITKQYAGTQIKILSVSKVGAKFIIIIKTESGKDKVVVNKNGKILSISDYLNEMEASGGC